MTAQNKTLRSLEDLAANGLLVDATPELQAVAAQFSVQITPALVKLIDPDNPRDPIALQYLPDIRESIVTSAERDDPIGDAVFSPVEGIIHRYPDRCLLTLLHTCAVYCRFCFRRDTVGQGGGSLDTAATRAALDYIREHKEIWEVILSGGDPLTLSDRRLAAVINELNAIEHVKIIRIHTRVPVAAPEQVTPEMIAALKSSKPIYILLHCNHARELSPSARSAVARFVDAGMPMLSQSVLLRGVNDTVDAVRDLMRAFIECRIKPHYLHHPDLTRGTSHFRVSIEQGQALMKQLRGHLSGLCQPTYVLDIPGGFGKVPISAAYTVPTSDGWLVEDYQGRSHAYRDDI